MIVIKTEKVVRSDGAKCRKIIDVKALFREKLPKKYLDGTPCCYCAQLVPNGRKWLDIETQIRLNPVINKTGTNYIVRIGPGDIIPENDFKKIRWLLKGAGQRLKLVNEELKRLEKTRNGTETFII